MLPAVLRRDSTWLSPLSTERNRTSCAAAVHSSPPSPSQPPPSRCSRPAAAAAAPRRPAQPGQPPRRPTLLGSAWRSRPACARTESPAIRTRRCLNRRATCRSRSRRADSIPTPQRSSLPRTLAVTFCPTRDHVQCQQPPGAGAGPPLRVLHAHAPSPELPRPRPRRSLHPPVRGRPASAPVPARDESVRERRAKLALDPQPTSRQLLATHTEGRVRRRPGV